MILLEKWYFQHLSISKWFVYKASSFKWILKARLFRGDSGGGGDLRGCKPLYEKPKIMEIQSKCLLSQSKFSKITGVVCPLVEPNINLQSGSIFSLLGKPFLRKSQMKVVLVRNPIKVNKTTAKIGPGRRLAPNRDSLGLTTPPPPPPTWVMAKHRP